MTYLFFFGNSPDLALAELTSILPPAQGEALHMASVESNLEGDKIIEIAKLLGGTVKLGVVFDKTIAEELEAFAQKEKLNKISFGISQYSSVAEKNDTITLSKKIKNEINPQFKVRFVLPKFPAQELSSVVIKKQLIIEVSIIKTPEKNIQARTIWVQDFEDWGKRDYGRPAAAGHIGMLPPKVARMMVNLALPGLILDPFCGVGTIPAEGLILGANVIGSDLNKNQVEKTAANLKWLCDAYRIQNSNYQIYQCDAPNVAKVLKQQVDAIVTEPDLGQIPQVSGNLVGLYLACLKNWKEILKPGGKIVIALPSYSGTGNISQDNNQYLVKTVIDKAKIMGYSVSQGPFVYARPQAKVIRNIIVFAYGTH